MSLPPRQPKKPKREARWRSQTHLRFVRGFQCAVPGCQGMPIEAAHVRMNSGAGMGEKPADYRAVPLCREHHSGQHSQGERTFWKSYQAASGQDVEALIEALCNDSPKRRDIMEARKA